jgi:hypothetical protein
MVDTTPAEVCEDRVIFIIQTATYMTATDGNIDDFLVQRAVLTRDTDQARVHQNYVKNTVRLCRYSKLFACETRAR